MRPDEQMATYLDRLFGHHEGTVALGLGIKGVILDTGHYFFGSGRLRHRYFSWPDQRQKLIDAALRAAPEDDVYVIPNLRTARSAKLGFCLAAHYCWADIDVVSDDLRLRLGAVLSKGSFIVHSGRGLHVYILLDKFYGPNVLEDLNERLAQYLPADSKWRTNSLLRLPGTFNHKGRARGRTSLPVVIEDITDSIIPPWSPSDLRKLLGPLPKTTKSTRRATPGTKRGGGRRATARPKEIELIKPEPIPEDLPESIRRSISGTFQPVKTGGDQTRSGELYAFVGHLMAPGYRDGQIMSVAMKFGPVQDKWPNKHDRRIEIQKCINKLRPKHPHAGLT
jgi:hypothetical protein